MIWPAACRHHKRIKKYSVCDVTDQLDKTYICSYACISLHTYAYAYSYMCNELDPSYTLPLWMGYLCIK